MALQREVVPRPLLVADGRQAVLRIRKADRDRLEKHLFQRYPDREWGTFFRFGYRRTSWGIAIFFVDPILPLAGDLDRQSGATVFKEPYSLRALRLAEDRHLGIGVIHSHPAGYFVDPSELDDDMDLYFAKEVQSYGAGLPYASLIFQRNHVAGFTFTGRVHDRGQWLAVTTMLTVGTVLEREMATNAICVEHRGIKDAEDESVTARLEEILGMRAKARLSNSKVGFIGCSGTGSPGIGVLARAGVSDFVLADPQRFAPSNLERVHGSGSADVSEKPYPYKVELQRRHIHSINPTARVTAFVGNALQENVLDELLLCDVAIGSSDSVHGRVFLSDCAKHYLLPSLDVGVAMEGKHGLLLNQIADFTRYGPDLPCLFCNGIIDTTPMTYELMSEEEKAACRRAAQEALERGDDPDQYWRGQRQLHTVGYLTTVIGALAAGYVEGWLTGAFRMPHDSFQFDIGQKNFGFSPTPLRQADCSCNLHLGWADQARCFRNVARPNNWPSRAVLLCRI